MKKTLLTISAVITTCISAMAQGAPDFSFENWHLVPLSSTVKDPNGWASLNTLVAAGTVQSVFRDTITPFAGTASVKITTVKIQGAAIPNPYRPGTNLDTCGLLVVGKVNVTPPQGIKYGYSYAWRPAVLSFQSKYTPGVGGDSAFVLVLLTKWTGSHRDTVARGKYATGATTTAYALHSITLTYNPAFSTVMPDSEAISISSSVYSHGGAKMGSAFYIDDLAWSGYNSTNEINGIVNSVSVYPNPATNSITFTSSLDATSVEITDITGRLVGTYSMFDKNVNIATSAFNQGMYMYSILNSKKEVMNKGKFEVAR